MSTANDQFARFSDLIEPLNPESDFKEQQRHIKGLLFRYLSTKAMVAFVGAGCSKPLGYPLLTKLVGNLLKDLEKLAKANGANVSDKKEIARLMQYCRAVRIPDQITPRTILGKCARLYERLRNESQNKNEYSFRKVFQERFREMYISARDSQTKSDCYPSLLALPIYRFVTTNYDLEIENALVMKDWTTAQELFAEKKPVTSPFFHKGKPIVAPFCSRKSFTQEPGCSRQLSYVPLALNRAYRHQIFHCHGRMDNPESYVLTENDYRKWYLEDTGQVRSLQETMEVLFGSNSLLLLGYSMNDSELMHILQLVHARRGNDANRSPLFVLLYIEPSKYPGTALGNKKEREKGLKDICDSLYERYGAYVIPVLGGEAALRNRLKTLLGELDSWRKEIRAQPSLKTFDMKKSREYPNYFHYGFAQLGEYWHSTKAYEDLREELNKRLASARGKKRFVVLMGDAGIGKTWSVQQFAGEFLGDDADKSKRVFFWSSYYTNDVYTGIKRALKFGGRDTNVGLGNYLPEFEKLLLKNKSLFIFDGIERLLSPDEANITNGNAMSEDVRRFFRSVTNSENEAFVILTSRLWPLDLVFDHNLEQPKADELTRLSDELKKKQLLRVSECKRGDLEGMKGFEGLSAVDLGALCSLLNGQIYCLSLVARMLDQETSGKEKALEVLLCDLAGTPPDQRPDRVLGKAILGAAEPEAPNPEQLLRQKVLERVALFMNPVERPVLDVCIELAKAEIDPTDKAKKEDGSKDIMIDSLLKSALLIQIKFNDSELFGYTVHPLLQNYVRSQLHHSVFSSHPNMILPGFTSAFEVVDPGSKKGKDVSKKLFEELCEKAAKKGVEAAEARLKAKARSGRQRIKFQKSARSLQLNAGIYCRSAFGVIRSRFSANTVARWGNYDDYRKMLYQLYDVARTASPAVWQNADESRLRLVPSKRDSIKHPQAPLYLDELAWLSNELGLVAFSIGDMLDTMFLWQQAFGVNELLDGNSNGIYRFQAYFNLGSAFIHLGRLYQAHPYLDEALRLTYEMKEEKLRGRVLGYFGLLKYLQGSLDEAEEDFEAANKLLQGNPRGLSVFTTYRGELLLKRGDIKGARRMIAHSRSLAEGAYFPDLVGYARLANANLLRTEGNLKEAQREYSAALAAAEKFGLRRLQAGALSGLSRWSYALNDSEGAREKAIAALKVANEASLGLHQTLSLLNLGRALLLSNRQHEMGIAHLRSALHLSKTQGYFLRSAEAEVELRNAGEEVEVRKDEKPY
jgi:tetratricopeptide (TPR) repeat protein